MSHILTIRRTLALAGLLAALSTAARADVLAHWTFDEITGPDHDTLPDASGHLNSENSKMNATASDKSQLSLNVASDVPFGKAITFTGKPGSYLDVPFISSIHQHSFTVAVWVYLNKPEHNYVLADWSGPLNFAYAFGFDVSKGSTTPRITAYLKSDVVKTNRKKEKYNVDVLKFTPAATNTISLNAWHHVAWVWDRQDKTNGTLTIYLDGVSVQSASVAKGSTTDLLNNHREVRVGLKQDTNSTFNGSMDELWVFGDALTPDQITNLMKTNNINTPPSAPTQLAVATPAAPIAPTPPTPTTPTPATPEPITPASPAPTAAPTAAAPTPPPITPSTPTTPEPLTAAATPTARPPSITPSTPIKPDIQPAATPVVSTPYTPSVPTLAVTHSRYTPERMLGILTSGTLALCLSSFLLWATKERSKLKPGRR